MLWCFDVFAVSWDTQVALGVSGANPPFPDARLAHSHSFMTPSKIRWSARPSLDLPHHATKAVTIHSSLSNINRFFSMQTNQKNQWNWCISPAIPLDKGKFIAHEHRHGPWVLLVSLLLLSTQEPEPDARKFSASTGTSWGDSWGGLPCKKRVEVVCAGEGA